MTQDRYRVYLRMGSAFRENSTPEDMDQDYETQTGLASTTLAAVLTNPETRVTALPAADSEERHGAWHLIEPG